MIEQLYERFKECSGASTDTRNIERGSMFFALKGPNFNANTFAQQALEKGAKYVVIDEARYQVNDSCIVVEDVLTTLQRLANHHRKQFDIPFIGITGSNGKTTTKELMKCVLEQKYKVHATLGNLNNHIGVPLTLLAIDNSIEIAIVEMGANRLGDIAELCAIAEPTHGLITNIGRAHVGYFGGFENIIRAKSELYQYLIENNGQVWINSKNEILNNMAKRFKAPLFYPANGDYYHAEFNGATPYVNYISEEGTKVSTHLVGEYNFENIAAVLCIGKYFEVDPNKANEAIQGYIPSNNRSQIIKKGSNTIIMDAYNANPSSMEAAISNMAAMKSDYKVIVLGDMYELGDESDMEHEKLGELLNQYQFDEVYYCGKLIKPALNSYPHAMYFEDKEELGKMLVSKNYDNAVILLKASRGIGLETVLGSIN